MEKIKLNSIYKVIGYVLREGIYKAVKYESEILRVKATKKQYAYYNPREIEILITIGRPNYLERKFISLCKKSGEKFPIKKVQVS